MSYSFFFKEKWRTKYAKHVCIDRNRRLGPNRGPEAPLGGAPSAAR